jgi:hypothetical protein
MLILCMAHGLMSFVWSLQSWQRFTAGCAEIPALISQIVVLEAAEARLQAAAAAASSCEHAAQRQQQLSAAVARRQAALQEAQQTIARLQRWDAR